MKEPPEEVDVVHPSVPDEDIPGDDLKASAATVRKAEQIDDERPAVNGFELASNDVDQHGHHGTEEDGVPTDLGHTNHCEASRTSTTTTTDNGKPTENGQALVNGTPTSRLSCAAGTGDMALCEVSPTTEIPSQSVEFTPTLEATPADDCPNATKDVVDCSTNDCIGSSSREDNNSLVKDGDILLSTSDDIHSSPQVDTSALSLDQTTTMTIKSEPMDADENCMTDDGHLVSLENMLTLGDRIKMTERSRFGRLRKKRCLSPSLVSPFTAPQQPKRTRRSAPARRSPAKRSRASATKPASKSALVDFIEPIDTTSTDVTKLIVKLKVPTEPSTSKASSPKRKRKRPAQLSQASLLSTASIGNITMTDFDETMESVVNGGDSLFDDAPAADTLSVTDVTRSPNPIKLKWLQGDVVWFKVQGQPWWPAKVSCDPITGYCTKMKVNFHTMYYLRPFGERDAPEWVSSCQILTFRGRDKFLQYVDSILGRFPVDSHFYIRTHTKFHVAPSKRDAWEAAIMEADVACRVATAMEESLENLSGDPGTPQSARKRKSIKLSRHEVKLFSSSSEKQNGSVTPDDSMDDNSKKSSRALKKVAKALDNEFDNAKLTTKETKAAKLNAQAVPPPPKTNKSKAVPITDYIKKLVPGATKTPKNKIKLTQGKGGRARIASLKKKNAILTEILLPTPDATTIAAPTVSKSDNSRNDAVLTLIFTPPKERIRIRRRKSTAAPPTPNGVGAADGDESDVKGEPVPRRRNRNPAAKKRLRLADESGGVELATLLGKGSAKGKSAAAAFQKNVDSILLQGASVLPTALTNDRKRRTKSPASKSILPESGQNSGDSDSATESSSLAKKDCIAEGKNDKFCLVCEKAISSTMVPLRCEGVCQGLVHDFCVNPASTTSPSEGYKCEECVTGIHSCFVCKKKSGEQETRKCGIYRCGKFYHESCLSSFRSAKMEGRSITCSLHSCLSCTLRNNRSRAGRGRLCRCLRCPTAFHNSESCLPAGSSVLSGSTIICPVHYKPKKSSKNLHINVNWCFVCSTGGSLICCESCPASFHAECLNIVPPEGSYYCAECTAGTQPKYGDIVWVKLGVYRWWPAKICSPRSVPANIQNLPHVLGEFPVHFFGTKDYYWTSRSRVFQFLEGDQSAQDSSSNRFAKVFQKALQDALQAFHEWKQVRETREAQFNERDSWKLPAYKHIKVNKPVGKATVPTVDPSQMTPCECDPNSENPCGSDSECLNRMLMFECHPDLCRAGSRCQNRRFEMQQYCPAEPFKAEGKGWGLKSLVEVKKGDFVNEYVGEIIDEEECRRRMKRMHEENNTSYYFLTIDKDRIIDAARKGNLSRFMNHSCQPNCETHKWTVNGEKRVGLFAVRHIPIGTELTFNYNLDCLGNEKTTCKCGAPNCSGFIGERPKNNLVKNKKPDKLVAGKKKRRRPRKIKLEVAEHDDECFRCGQDGELLMCDRKNCTKTYHLSCLDLAKPPHGRWDCPWHHCDICGRRAVSLCFVCPNSYCKNHSAGNTHKMADGNICCRDHIDEDVKTVHKRKSGVLKNFCGTSVTVARGETRAMADGCVASSPANLDPLTSSESIVPVKRRVGRSLGRLKVTVKLNGVNQHDEFVEPPRLATPPPPPAAPIKKKKAVLAAGKTKKRIRGYRPVAASRKRKAAAVAAARRRKMNAVLAQPVKSDSASVECTSGIANGNVTACLAQLPMDVSTIESSMLIRESSPVVLAEREPSPGAPSTEEFRKPFDVTKDVVKPDVSLAIGDGCVSNGDHYPVNEEGSVADEGVLNSDGHPTVANGEITRASGPARKRAFPTESDTCRQKPATKVHRVRRGRPPKAVVVNEVRSLNGAVVVEGDYDVAMVAASDPVMPDMNGASPPAADDVLCRMVPDAVGQ